MANAPNPDPQKENPEAVGAELGVGIEGLPGKVSRYGKAKKGALDVAEYMATIPKHQAAAARVMTCGDYLVFRHYYTRDEVRLHGAYLCKKHLLCPLCAIRRGAKALKAYLDRWDAIKAANPALRPFLVTLTVRDGSDLLERFHHLYKGQRELWMRKARGRGSVLDGVHGAVWSYEVKRGSGSGKWHPHLHMIALAETMPDQEQLAQEWKNITGDSHVVDVRPISQEDPVSGFIEVFKYAVKFSDQAPEDTVHAWETLAGKRLLGSAGCFRGVEVSADLLDESEGFDGLPFWAMFYKYLPAGYSLAGRQHGAGEPLRRPELLGPPKPASSVRQLRALVHDRLLREKLTIRSLPGGYQLNTR